ncbi:uncharacterized protein A1O9_06469 [Exophiala aquamarina CBS 119918]|uniref:Sexual development protein n=1 Tax=Exophiala aquamarina CBS 119918 TaxID=1182545 RepID=A0A072PGV7_9EURO|nr:uncharacterized protein A1O9_06469 [Exophiala aquamarina CBS 119918]KEF58543.1 hypothetical protein A1O9_06469 [Exophiala aquamarina CBS 119918]
MQKTAAFVALAALLSASSAAPLANGNWQDHQSGNAPAPAPAPSSPFAFPLSNGFPNLSPAALQAVEVQAQGTEPNGAAPTGLSEDDLTSIRLIAFNELFEVAFFTDLLYNVTNRVSGFEVPNPKKRQEMIAAITAIQAQEELHAINANAILAANGQDQIQPCQYMFPSTTLSGALSFAKTFTDVVLGTLQDVQLHLATNGVAGVVPIIGSVIGQEGEQNGFFRTSTGLIPSSQPFLTRSARAFAFSALNQAVVVPNSCPNAQLVGLPVFQPLNVITAPITPNDQTLQFSIAVDESAAKTGVSMAFINGQNTPLVQEVNNINFQNGVATFEVDFPYTENLLNGLTIAALVAGNGPFADADEVAQATLAGPGLIEIN